MSEGQPEIVKGWKLEGFGRDACAVSPFSYNAFIVQADDVTVEAQDVTILDVPRDALTRFVERMNHVDPNAEDDRKLGAAVREALNRSARAFTSHAKYLEAVANELDFDNRPIAANLLRAIASALRNEAAK